MDKSDNIKVGVLTIATKEGGGIYQYTLSLVEALKKYSNKFNYIQITTNSFPRILDNCIYISTSTQKLKLFLKLKRTIHAITRIRFGDLLGPYNHPDIKNLDLVISPVISLLPYHMGKPYIVTIHDFQQEYYPQFFTFKERLVRKIVYKTGQKANLVVCESEYVKKDIMKFLKVKEDKIKVIISPPPSYISQIELDERRLINIKRKHNLPDKFLFYPAQFWFHKNHIRLLQALALLKEKYDEKISLVLIGSEKNNFKNTMNEIKKLKLQDDVIYLGYIPQEDIPVLYKLATALVMPSLFESVSIPIWEAFHLGCPVISSNVCALPEQVGDAGLLFNPYDIEDMAEKIYRIWTDEELRKELIKKGYERVKNLTLENYAKQWEEVIKEALEMKE